MGGVRGKLEEAVADYDRAVEINPRYSEAYNNRGAVRFTEGKLEEAIADFDRAIESNPRNAEAFMNRGLARLLQGRTEEAERDFKQCLKLDAGLKPWLEGRIKEIKQARTAK